MLQYIDERSSWNYAGDAEYKYIIAPNEKYTYIKQFDRKASGIVTC